MGWLGGPDGMEATGSDGRRGRRGSLGLPAAALAPVIDNVAISDLTVAVGQTVSAVITYTEGTPPFTETYQWSLGGSPISGATSSTYTATTAGALTVAVESTNDEGSDTATSGAAQVYVVPAMTSVTIDDTAVSTGDTLTASWTTSGTAPITVALQWVRAGVDISGATGTTYVTQPADGGQVIQVRATPSNPGATGTAVLSPPTTVYDPPVVVSVALSSYAALLGATLTATPTVTGTFPITTTWRWLRNGVAISGATASTYTLVTADVGTLISAEATGAGVVATSAPTVSPTATVSTVPSIGSVTLDTSSVTVGATITATANTVTGTPTPTVTWRWLRAGTPISGATSAAYVTQVADVGLAITAEATATSSAGSDVEVSSAATVTSAQMPAIRRAGLSDDTLETTATVAASSAMTFLIWVKAITAHDASAPCFLCWGVPSGTGVVDPGVMIRFNPASSDRLEALIGRAGTSASAQVNLTLPGGVTDITTMSNFLVWLTLDGTNARLGIGDPAGGVLATGTVTGGVDTGSTTVASLFGRNGTTARGLAGTLAVGVVGEVLSDSAIAAVAAAGITGPAAAVAASSQKRWAPRPTSGVADGADLVTTPSSNIEDVAGVHTANLTAGSARLKAAA